MAKALRFYIILVSYLFLQIFRGNEWHMITADFDCGKDGRRRLVGKRSCGSLDMYWHDMNWKGAK